VLNRCLPPLLVLIAVLLAGDARAQEPGQERAAAPEALTEREKIAHLLNRFTLGASPALVDKVEAQGWRKWFRAQIAAKDAPSEESAARLERYPSLQLTLQELFEQYAAARREATTQAEKKAAQRLLNTPRKEMLAGTVLNAVYDEVPVRQTAADFFRNHFSVDLGKGNLKLLAVTWERDLIQGMPLGKFGDLLDRTARHPAMLFFLDNHLSRRPATEAELQRIRIWAAKRPGEQREARAARQLELAAQRGLNENYARELLELHTLGVDNYYTQDDIIQVAKCLTGWTIAPRKARAQATDDGFFFARAMHCDGDKTFLGGVIKAAPRDPEAEGQAVLDQLKRHPGTAHFLSWKLCRWFVNDTPDDAMVDRIAKRFTAVDGDIGQVLLAIAEDPAFFDRANYRVKFKRPWEYVISALRVTGAEVQSTRGVLSALAEMNEPLYRCPDPTGYYDQAEAWCDPGALAPRWAFANDLVSGRLRGVKLPAELFAGLPEDDADAWVGILDGRIFPGGGCSAETRRTIESMVTQMRGRKKRGKSRPALVGRLIVAALLGSPDFQKQ